MSDQNQQGGNPLPTPEAAYDHLFDQVHSRVFFGKLAEAGFAPQTQKEADDLLALAGKLRSVQDDPQVKAAAANDSRFAEASSGLDGLLGQTGLDGQLKQAAAQEADASMNQAVEQLAADPDIFNSVLALKAAEAEEIGQHYGITPQGQAPAPATA